MKIILNSSIRHIHIPYIIKSWSYIYGFAISSEFTSSLKVGASIKNHWQNLSPAVCLLQHHSRGNEMKIVYGFLRKMMININKPFWRDGIKHSRRKKNSNYDRYFFQDPSVI